MVLGRQIGKLVLPPLALDGDRSHPACLTTVFLLSVLWIGREGDPLGDDVLLTVDVSGRARSDDLMDSARPVFLSLVSVARSGDRDRLVASAVVVGNTCLQVCVISAATWQAAENKKTRSIRCQLLAKLRP